MYKVFASKRLNREDRIISDIFNHLVVYTVTKYLYDSSVLIDIQLEMNHLTS